ncbi:MAG: hypothetical protein OHK0032_13140 [Thermodesulfovibrionales bacterium]
MEAYRYQELAYLIVPVILGIEFFMCAKDERKEREETPLGSYALDFLGFVFTALIPAIFIFTVWAVESKAFPSQSITLARLDRYAVLFFFMGAWWQVYIFGALRARRMEKKQARKWFLWVPFLILGIFISLLVLWVSPWSLKWVSVVWFIFIFGVLNVFKARARIIERTMWVLSIITFVIENILFLWLESVV